MARKGDTVAMWERTHISERGDTVIDRRAVRADGKLLVSLKIGANNYGWKLGPIMIGGVAVHKTPLTALHVINDRIVSAGYTRIQ